MINIIAIRATYYIFCCRNRNWDSPDFAMLIEWCFFFWLLFCFVFVFCFFLFNNPISNSICKLPIRSEIYNCTFKNTNKVSIIIIKDNHFHYHKDTYSINKSQSSFTNINHNITKYKFNLINFNYYKLLEQLQARYFIFFTLFSIEFKDNI